jgi:class 3 adenylate cyclase
VVIGFLAYRSNQTLEENTRAGLDQQADILQRAIENAMLPGEAPIAVSLLEEIRKLNPDYDINLLRAGGVEAFSDNSTIAQVNANLGYRAFKDKETLPFGPLIIEGDESFDLATSQVRRITVREHGSQGAFSPVYDVIYAPLINRPRCAFCHGSDHTVRGVLRVRNNVSSVVATQTEGLAISGGIFLAVVVFLTLVLTTFLHRNVINPVKQIAMVCAGVTGGDFDNRVEVANNDEIGQLGDTVNEMVQGLYERFQLSKYVSASTIASIRNKEKGARARLTLFFSDVRGFTRYSEGRDPEQVVEYLNRLLTVQTGIIHDCGGDIDKYVGDEVVALFSGPEQALAACRAAVRIQREVFGADQSRYGGLDVGIGINTGAVILGRIGSETRADFTAIGDHVNFASRLCDAAKAGEIIIADSTRRQAGGGIAARGPYRARVKGREQAERVYVLETAG